ncbi:MAG: amidohydrolase family protein [bacterium]
MVDKDDINLILPIYILVKENVSMKSLTILISVLGFLLSFLWTPARGQSVVPNVIFYNGKVLTMEKNQPEAEAIAIRGETIVAVGSNAEILALGTPETQVIDLEGKTLLPGFVDAHTHIFNDAEAYLGLSLEEAQQLALKNGITTLADMYVPPEFLEQMQNLAQEGKLRIRTSLYLIYTTNCGDVQGDWYKAHPPTREPGEMLRIGGVKIFADGGSCGLPALSFEYPDGGYGDLWLTEDQLKQAVAEAQAAGYQVVIHAIGDRAIETAQNAIQFALAGAPNTLRHRIEHNSIIRPDLLTRYSETGTVVTIFGYYRTCADLNGGGWAPYVRPERFSWIRPYRALMEANPGLHIAWHGDDPWIGPISPILELYNTVTRKELAEDSVTICEPREWLAATAIPVQEALPMMTIESAYALFRDEEVGSLKPGKFADLVILSDNPLSVDPDSIKDIELLMTMVGGRVEYCASGQEALCPDLSTSVSSPETEGWPETFELSQNYPNPFNPTTIIQYQVFKRSHVKLVIYNILGQKIATLVNEVQPAGVYSVAWHGMDDRGRNVASGIYLHKLETGGFVKVKKMLLLR